MEGLIQQHLMDVDRRLSRAQQLGANVVKTASQQPNTLMPFDMIRTQQTKNGNTVFFTYQVTNALDFLNSTLTYLIRVKQKAGNKGLNESKLGTSIQTSAGTATTYVDVSNGGIDTDLNFHLNRMLSKGPEFVVKPWNVIQKIDVIFGSQVVWTYPESGSWAWDHPRYLNVKNLFCGIFPRPRPLSLDGLGVFPDDTDFFHYYNELNQEMFFKYPGRDTNEGYRTVDFPLGKFMAATGFNPLRFVANTSQIQVRIMFLQESSMADVCIFRNPHSKGVATSYTGVDIDLGATVDLSFGQIADPDKKVMEELIMLQNLLAPLVNPIKVLEVKRSKSIAAKKGAASIEMQLQFSEPRVVAMILAEDSIPQETSFDNKYCVPIYDRFINPDTGTLEFKVHYGAFKIIYEDCDFSGNGYNLQYFYKSFCKAMSLDSKFRSQNNKAFNYDEFKYQWPCAITMCDFVPWDMQVTMVAPQTLSGLLYSTVRINGTSTGNFGNNIFWYLMTIEDMNELVEGDGSHHKFPAGSYKTIDPNQSVAAQRLQRIMQETRMGEAMAVMQQQMRR